MILHIVQCEMCEQQFTFNPAVHPARRAAPDGWLTVFDAKDMQAQEGWHFCSATCLYHWTEVRLAIRDSEPVVISPFVRREEEGV